MTGFVIQLTSQLIACVSSHYYPKFRAGSNDNSNYKQANTQSWKTKKEKKTTTINKQSYRTQIVNNQSKALFTVMIFYDNKSLTWYHTISWTVSKTRTFLQTLEMKITTELQRKVKLLHLLNEKVICLMLSEKTNASSRQHVTRLHCRALACTFTDTAETFLFQNEARFSKFLS